MGTQGIPGMSGEKGAKVVIHFMSFRKSVLSKSKHLEVGLKKPATPCFQVTFQWYGAFSLTLPASMQIYWNKRKRLHKKREFNSHGTALGHQRGRRFIVLGHQYGHRDVMCKRSILYGYYS